MTQSGHFEVVMVRADGGPPLRADRVFNDVIAVASLGDAGTRPLFRFAAAHERARRPPVATGQADVAFGGMSLSVLEV
ncbi:hypothetical protein ACQEU6_01065 [Spirillospora sp. CA-108201]